MATDIEAAQRKLSGRVMGKPGISGTAIGLKGGKPCLTVYVNGEVEAGLVPGSISGFRVVVERTGPFRRL